MRSVRGPAAVGRIPAAEIRQQEPGSAGDRGGDCRVVDRRRGGQLLASDAGDSGREECAGRRGGREGCPRARQKRLAQIEKRNEIIISIFTDLDIHKVKEGTEPLEAMLANGW